MNGTVPASATRASTPITILVALLFLGAPLLSAITAQDTASPAMGAGEDLSVMTLTGRLTFARDDLQIRFFGGEHFFTLDGGVTDGEPGTAALPAVPASFVVPADSKPLSWEVLGYDPLSLGTGYVPHINSEPLPVSVPAAPEDMAPAASPEGGRYPTEIGAIAGGGWTRDFRLADFIIHPLMFDPADGSLTLYRTIDVRFDILTSQAEPKEEEMEGWEGWSEYIGDPFLRSVCGRSLNPQHAQAFRVGDMAEALALGGGVAGGGSLPASSPVLADGQYDYVIITTSTLDPTLQELADWKDRKGIHTKMVDVSWIYSQYTGDNPAKVRSFISDAVTQWNVTYVLLGGDVSQVPYRGCYGKVGSYVDNNIPSDLYFMGLSGDWNADSDTIYGETTDSADIYPDVYATRFPVETAAQAQNMVDKVLTYEMDPNPDYLLEMLFFAEWLDASTDGGIGKNTIDTTYVPSRFNITRLYESDGNLSDATVSTEIGRGKGIANHIGHCNWNVMAIGPSSISLAEALAFDNGDDVGILYSIGCIANSFERNDCIAENWLLNTVGGAVAFCGNSRYGWYSPGNPGGGMSDLYDQQFFNQLFPKDNYNLGSTLAESKAYFAPWSGSLGASRWVTFAMNAIGDAQMPIWTDTPANLTVSHPAQGFYGLQTIPVQVKDEGASPVGNALVCIMGTGSGTGYGTAITDSKGWAYVPIDVDTYDVLNVTATAHNYLPYMGNMTVGTDTTDPTILINDDDYGWFSVDPGNVVDVDFNGTGETDIAWAQYQTDGGSWEYIIDTSGHVPVLDEEWNISAVFASLPDGVTTFHVRCEDGATNPASESDAFVVRKDTVPPGVTVNSNTYGWYTSDPGTVIDVDFTNLSTGSPLRNASWNMGYPFLSWYPIFSSQVAVYDANWALPWDMMQEGQNTISINLHDAAGNLDATDDQITFLKDTYAPYVTLNVSQYGWYSQDPGDVIDVDFSNGGNGSLLDSAQYRVGSGAWTDVFTADTADFTDQWGVDWSGLAEGVNDVGIRTFDAAGLEDATDDEVTFRKDTVPPQVVVSGQVFGWYTDHPGAVIDVNFTNGGSGSNLARAQYRVVDGPGNANWVNVSQAVQSDYTDVWEIPWYDLAQGNNTVELRVFDVAGNMDDTVDVIYVLKDTENPTLVVNKGDYGWWTADPGDVIDVDFFNGGDGSALDYAGYMPGGVDNWTIIFDDDVDDYLLNWSVDFDTLGEGENTVYLCVFDSSGQEDTTSDAIYIKRDTLPPLVKYSTDTFGWYTLDPGAAINVDFGNGGSGSLLARAQFRVGTSTGWTNIFNNTLANFGGNWAIPWDWLVEGENLIDVRVFDVAGWEDNTTDTIRVLKDITPPTVAVNSVNYGWYSQDPGAVVDVDFTDGGGGAPIIRAEYQFEDEAQWHTIFDEPNGTTAFSDNWTIDWDLAPEGVRMVYIRVIDAAGQEDLTDDYVLFMKDTSPPRITVYRESYGWYDADPGDKIDVDFTNGGEGSPLSYAACWVAGSGVEEENGDDDGRAAPDAGMPAQPWYIFQTGQGELGPAVFRDDWGVEFDEMPEGACTLRLYVEDMGGNGATDTIEFKKDTLPPKVVDLRTPDDGETTTRTKQPLAWYDTTDAASGVTGYFLEVSTSQLFIDTLVQVSQEETTFTPADHLDLGVYYWRVSAVDMFDHRSNWSDVWSLEVISGDTEGVNDPPVADAGPDEEVNVGQMVRFDGSASRDPEGGSLKFFWDFDGQGTSTAVEPFFPFWDPGAYTVTLTVADSEGLEGTDTVVITVVEVTDDQDGDGIPDQWEAINSLDPQDSADGEADADGDGYTNKDEYDAGTDPWDAVSRPEWAIVDDDPEDTGDGTDGGDVDDGDGQPGLKSSDKGFDTDSMFFWLFLIIIICAVIAIVAGVASARGKRKKEEETRRRLAEERERRASEMARSQADEDRRILEASSTDYYQDDFSDDTGMAEWEDLTFAAPAAASAPMLKARPPSGRKRPPSGRGARKGRAARARAAKARPAKARPARAKPAKARPAKARPAIAKAAGKGDMAPPPPKPKKKEELPEEEDEEELVFEEDEPDADKTKAAASVDLPDDDPLDDDTDDEPEFEDEAVSGDEANADDELEFDDEAVMSEDEAEADDELEFDDEAVISEDEAEADDELEFDDEAGTSEDEAEADDGLKSEDKAMVEDDGDPLDDKDPLDDDDDDLEWDD